MILRGLDAAANGMNALIDMNDNTANNIANVNTVGYKRSRLTFKNILDSQVVAREGNGQQSTVRSLGTLSVGSEIQKLTYDFEQGSFNKTDNPFDLTVEGDGFFKVRDANGRVSYTRNGSFTLNNNSDLVTKDGDYVLDVRDRPIHVRTNNLQMHSMKDFLVTSKGEIEINNEINPLRQQQIKICDFSNKEDMTCIGSSKFVPNDPATNPELRAEKFTVVQGGLEMSNANIIREMINTINTSRGYESLSKVVKESATTLDKTIQMGRIKGMV